MRGTSADRHRSELVRKTVYRVQHMHEALTRTNLQIQHVILLGNENVKD